MSPTVKRYLANCVLMVVVASLAWYGLGCGNDDAQSEEPDTAATIVAAAVKTILEATAVAQANEAPTATPSPTATSEPSPTPTMVATIPPTPTQATAPSGGDGGDPGSAGEFAPLPIGDLEALLNEVSDAERACLTQSRNLSPDRLAQLASSPELATPEERSAFLGCLEHDTELRLMLTPVLTATGPLSVESSACLRSSYADVDLHELMGGMLADPSSDAEAQAAMARGMVMFIVSLSCLNQEEFAMAGQGMGVAPGEYEGFQCVLEAAGGQEGLVVWLSPGAEFPAALFEAAFGCGLQMGAGPPPG